MSRRPRYYRYYDKYDYRPYRRGGCWYRLKRFISNVAVILLCLLGAAFLVGLALLAYTYQAYLETIFLVILGIGAFILTLVLLKFIIGMIAAMVNAISAMRVRAVEAGRAKVELSKRKLERDAYQQRLPYPQQSRRVLTASLPSDLQEPPVQRVLPSQLPLKSEVPGMPEYTTVRYCDIEGQVKPGQLVALVRPNGSLRLETWNAFKVLLVLGGSASGKSTTIAEKVLGFVNGGGLIVPCDPHDSKEDSLFKKIAPLTPALYPGAVFAVEHADILRNMRLVNTILEERVQNPTESRVPVLLVVEELNRLLRDKALTKEISLILEALGEEGRGFNVFVLVGCQRVTGLSDIRKAFISFIVHRCDESEARLVIPYRYAKYGSELRPGQCFVKDGDGVTEAGLQVLVTRRDTELASLHLSQSRPPSRPRPTVPLNRQRPTVPLNRQRPTVPLNRQQQPATQTFPRQVHKTRLRPVEPETETRDRRGSNPLHTWAPPPLVSKKSPENSPLSDSRGSRADSPPTNKKDTEELLPSDLSISQQFEVLALIRKKKNQK